MRHSGRDARCSRNPQAGGGIKGGQPVVGHNAPAHRERFCLPNWKRLPNIERAKKYKSECQITPVQGGCEEEREALAEDLVHNDALWIIDEKMAGHMAGCNDADKEQKNQRDGAGRSEEAKRQMLRRGVRTAGNPSAGEKCDGDALDGTPGTRREGNVAGAKARSKQERKDRSTSRG